VINVRRVVIICLLLGGLLGLMALTMSERSPTSAKEPNVEAAVCGAFREPLMFWLWHNMAGAANPRGLANIRAVEPVKFTTRDGITLAGYKLAAEKPNAYLLVALGNAMNCDEASKGLRFDEYRLANQLIQWRGNLRQPIAQLAVLKHRSQKTFRLFENTATTIGFEPFGATDMRESENSAESQRERTQCQSDSAPRASG